MSVSDQVEKRDSSSNTSLSLTINQTNECFKQNDASVCSVYKWAAFGRAERGHGAERGLKVTVVSGCISEELYLPKSVCKGANISGFQDEAQTFVFNQKNKYSS